MVTWVSLPPPIFFSELSDTDDRYQPDFRWMKSVTTNKKNKKPKKNENGLTLNELFVLVECIKKEEKCWEEEVSFGLQDTVSDSIDTTLLTAYTSKKKCRGNSMRNTGNQELKVLFVQGEIYEDKIFKIG